MLLVGYRLVVGAGVEPVGPDTGRKPIGIEMANETWPASAPVIQMGAMRRRTLIQLIAALVLSGPRFMLSAQAEDAQVQPTLFSAPLKLGGDWGGSPPSAATIVISRMREVCLSGLKLLSDQQPDALEVDDHTSGSPAIWLHDDHSKTAWIIVDIGARDWCKLSYQFGHELGHVLCNSWGPLSKPQEPSQWLEEALVEAFSIRGLALLAASWAQNPPFAGDAAFANAIRQYRENLIANYKKTDDPTLDGDIASWFRKKRNALEHISTAEGPAILAILAELERDKACVEDLGAINRWPARSGVPIEDYLNLWAASCAQIHAPGRLPVRLRTIFQLG